MAARLRRAAVIAALGAGLLAGPVGAQTDGPFSPVVVINERAITRYELDQRLRFLTLLRQPGDLEKLAYDGLVEDRLRLFAAKQLGLTATPEQVLAGMAEFAGRANLSAEQFVEAIGQGGVAAESFRDFVEAGLIWREVVRAKFGPFVSVTENDIDRAIDAQANAPAVRVRLSEIVIPVADGGVARARARADEIKAGIRGAAGFAAAARANSASATAARGGQLDWVPLRNLPQAIAGAVIGLQAGQVAGPIPVQGAFVLLFLNDFQQDTSPGSGAGALIDYAQFLIPNDAGAEAELARVRANTDTCDDLYTLARGLPADRLLRDTQSQGSIPSDIALELARLDPGEVSGALVRGGWRVALMLCSRNANIGDTEAARAAAAETVAANAGAGILSGVPTEAGPDRSAIRTQLINQRLNVLAEGYLEELRSEAIIRTP